MKKLLRIVLVTSVLLATVGIVGAGAGSGKNGKICMVTDLEGFGPFNAMAVEGLEEASRKLHVEAAILRTYDEPWVQIPANLDAFVTAGDCDLIIGVGFMVADFMDPFVSGNPEQKFAILDAGVGEYENLSEIVFAVEEASFLAGYIAAGVSETGKVGVFGGWPVPGVTLFMDGYAYGVYYYNDQHGTAVEVLGWDPDAQTGWFTFDFINPPLGQAFTADLYDQGADIVFPVAGPTGYGALDEANLRISEGDEVWVIGVDNDWYEMFGDLNRVILTSVLKDYAPAVYHQVEMIVDGTWEGGYYFEGLASGGVDIAKFHKTNRDVPGYLKNDLKAIRDGIMSGAIPTGPEFP